ncbi:hypothetical protein Tco_0615727 [Tanacetum coccineum]
MAAAYCRYRTWVQLFHALMVTNSYVTTSIEATSMNCFGFLDGDRTINGQKSLPKVCLDARAFSSKSYLERGAQDPNKNHPPVELERAGSEEVPTQNKKVDAEKRTSGERPLKKNYGDIILEGQTERRTSKSTTQLINASINRKLPNDTIFYNKPFEWKEIPFNFDLTNIKQQGVGSESLDGGGNNQTKTINLDSRKINNEWWETTRKNESTWINEDSKQQRWEINQKEEDDLTWSGYKNDHKHYKKSDGGFNQKTEHQDELSSTQAAFVIRGENVWAKNQSNGIIPNLTLGKPNRSQTGQNSTQLSKTEFK